MATEKEMPDIFKGTEMEKIYKKAQIASFTDKEYNEYVSEIMYEEDRRNQLATAYHQGKADDAVKMLSLGMDVELISKITGLSAEKISALGKGE
jgi:radical SAM superfamily enzyme